MATNITIEQTINKLADHFGDINGVKTAYGFSENPLILANEALPAIVFYPSEGTQEHKAFHNRHTNETIIRGSFMVVPQFSAGGDLRFLENTALVYPDRMRSKFQTESVIKDILGLGYQFFNFERWEYGAGGNLLTYKDTPYIGFVLTWVFRETS